MNTIIRHPFVFALFVLPALTVPGRAQSDGEVITGSFGNFIPGGTTVTVALGYTDYGFIPFVPFRPDPR